MQNIFTHILLIWICIFSVSSTITKSDQEETKYKFKIKSGPQVDSVFDRNLVVSEPFSREIIKEHSTYCVKTDYRNFNGAVLGYVTPWNNLGYEVSKTFANKFTNISPVWLQIKRRGQNKYEVTGTHDIDKNWISDLRASNSDIRVDVRVLFDGWTVQHFTALLTKDSEQRALSEAIVKVCVLHNFDGIVLELWGQIGDSVRTDVLINFIKTLSIHLKNNNLDLFLTIPPIQGNKEIFSASHFDDLYEFIAGFSLMSYDYSNPQRPGPNAPIEWVRSSVTTLVPEASERRSKILLGLNFYGNSFTAAGGGSIVGHEFIDLLSGYKGKLKFDDKSVENFFETKVSTGKRLVFYPTLYSINQRIKLAEELGTGLSLWELGQGLQYFYDLL